MAPIRATHDAVLIELGNIFTERGYTIVNGSLMGQINLSGAAKLLHALATQTHAIEAEESESLLEALEGIRNAKITLRQRITQLERKARLN